MDRFLSLVVLVVVVLIVGCGPASGPGAAQQPAAAPPAKPAAAEAPKPAAAAKPAEVAKPAQAPKPAEAAKPVAPERLLMGTTGQASSHYAYLVTASKIINSKVPEINITVRETGGSAENAELWVKNEVQISLLSTDIGYLLYNGLDKYQGRGRKDIRYLWVYTINPHVFVVRRDTGVMKLEDLNGKDFNPAGRGSSSEVMVKRALDTVGIKPRYYTASFEDAVQAIKDRRIVGYVKAQIGTQVDASTLDLMTAVPIRLLGFSKEQLDKFIAAHPYYGYAEVPAGTYKDLEENKVGLLFPSLTTAVATSTKMSEETAYKVVKAIMDDNKPGGEGQQAAAMAVMKTIDIPKATVEHAKAPLHAGAYKYLRETGVNVPEALIPPEVKR